MIGFTRRDRPAADVLETARLSLTAMTVATVEKEEQGLLELGEALGARLAGDWPPDLWTSTVRTYIRAQLTEQRKTLGWHRYMLLKEHGTPVLVGCLGAFPCAAGDVELGYSVANSWQRRGLATEAGRALIGWLLAREEVHSVSAQAYVSSPASVKVMERCGMRYVGHGDEPDTVRYRRWR